MPAIAIPALPTPSWPVLLGGLHAAARPIDAMSEPATDSAAPAGQVRTAAAETSPLALARVKICAALDAGDTSTARGLLQGTATEFPGIRFAEDWAAFWDMSAWSDAWLVAAIRRDPPDELALDALAARHWKNLFARCHMLTLDREKAADLAQDAWCRILRARTALRADGNFPAYISTIATNLWRDRYRAERRAGGLGGSRLLSLDAASPAEEGEGSLLGDLLPDLEALAASELARLKLDIDQALERLDPLLRDVLVARFLGGESCAEIGRRHGRTEQTVSGWVRQGVQEIRCFFEENGRTPTSKNSPS
jgi:RNA polymerase sigma factor (sigma-70 family)